jgi:hypothetical protein
VDGELGDDERLVLERELGEAELDAGDGEEILAVARDPRVPHPRAVRRDVQERPELELRVELAFDRGAELVGDDARREELGEQHPQREREQDREDLQSSAWLAMMIMVLAALFHALPSFSG